MPWIDSFVQATVIMCLGMGLVFAFVATLVVLIQISARVLSKYIEEEPVVAASATALPTRSDGVIVAAIAAAMKQYSSDKK